MNTSKLFLCLLITICVVFVAGEAMAAKGGSADPNQHAYQHANQNASFMRDGESEEPAEESAEEPEEMIEEEETTDEAPVEESEPVQPKVKKVAPIGYNYDPMQGHVDISGLETE